nr:BFH_HP1_G0048560.mRNA.1.CDS.1 [Saccharomyces cerevisiae]
MPQLTGKGKSQARHSAKLIKQFYDSNNISLPQIGYTKADSNSADHGRYSRRVGTKTHQLCNYYEYKY